MKTQIRKRAKTIRRRLLCKELCTAAQVCTWSRTALLCRAAHTCLDMPTRGPAQLRHQTLAEVACIYQVLRPSNVEIATVPRYECVLARRAGAGAATDRRSPLTCNICENAMHLPVASCPEAVTMLTEISCVQHTVSYAAVTCHPASLSHPATACMHVSTHCAVGRACLLPLPTVPRRRQSERIGASSRFNHADVSRLQHHHVALPACISMSRWLHGYKGKITIYDKGNNY